jgi:hypothetical protein
VKAARFRLGAFVLIALVAVIAGGVPQAGAIGSSIVISQIYGGGGNTGASHTHDFVELFNPADTPVLLDGLSIQYASATGTGNFGANSGQLTELSGSIQPHRYFLVREFSQAAIGAPLPAPDGTDDTPINLSGTAEGGARHRNLNARLQRRLDDVRRRGAGADHRSRRIRERELLRRLCGRSDTVEHDIRAAQQRRLRRHKPERSGFHGGRHGAAEQLECAFLRLRSGATCQRDFTGGRRVRCGARLEHHDHIQ